jgi:hypothetical protein
LTIVGATNSNYRLCMLKTRTQATVQAAESIGKVPLKVDGEGGVLWFRTAGSAVLVIIPSPQ